MSTVDIISFQEAIARTQGKKRILLAGNGFSIACFPDLFSYKSIFEQANLKEFPEIIEAFALLGNYDFEIVAECLNSTAAVLPAYGSFGEACEKIKQHSQKIREILVSTIAENHPAAPRLINDEQYVCCRTFLANFIDKQVKGAIYTVSYDLLLYWVLMSFLGNKDFEVEPCDGFGKDIFIEQDAVRVSDYVTWQGETKSNDQNVHYLHGALHLYDLGADVEKYTWQNSGQTLISQAKDAIGKAKFPIFVAEGDCLKKLTKIKHCAYLYHSYKSFSTRMNVTKDNCLFTFGFSFSDNDDHLIKKIVSGKISFLYVGLKGSAEENQKIINKIEGLCLQRASNSPLEVSYYDADSAKVWG